MKINQIFFTFCILTVICTLFSSCQKDDDNTYVFDTTTPDLESKLQETLINMTDGATIYLKQGNYHFYTRMTVNGKDNITLKGDGMDKTIISFADQLVGPEGFTFTNTNGIVIANMRVQDTDGDGIKVKDSKGVAFYNVAVEWTAAVETAENGAYALYPVSCEEVLIDGCYVKGASDAGIYVGQCNKVIVRNSEVEKSVAGIEIENCSNSEVYGNNAHNNTGGILVFDLPDLPVKGGMFNKVYNNTIKQNDHVNFAPSNGMVANVPTGTGILILSAREVDVYDNIISDNNMLSIGITSYETVDFLDPDITLKDTLYNPYPSNIFLHNNTITRNSGNVPPQINAIGQALISAFPDGLGIAFDGVIESSKTLSTIGLCIKDNNNAPYTNIDATNFFVGANNDVTPHICTREPFPAVVLTKVRKL